MLFTSYSPEIENRSLILVLRFLWFANLALLLHKKRWNINISCVLFSFKLIPKFLATVLLSIHYGVMHNGYLLTVMDAVAPEGSQGTQFDTRQYDAKMSEL